MKNRLIRWLNGETTAGRLRRMSDWAAARLDAIPGATPNRVTAMGLVLALIATFMFATGGIVLGAVFCTLSYVTDFLDGALARYQDDRLTDADRETESRKNWLAKRGKTEDEAIFSGASFDPFVDKVRYFGALITLGLGRLWWPLVAIGGFFALALTIGRPVVTKLKLSKGRANWLGKHKVHVEAALLVWLVFVPADRLPLGGNILLALASLGGLGSFAAQAWSVYRKRTDEKAPI
jgi:phosphatidylglycerophosphate synthase